MPFSVSFPSKPKFVVETTLTPEQEQGSLYIFNVCACIQLHTHEHRWIDNPLPATGSLVQKFWMLVLTL